MAPVPVIDAGSASPPGVKLQLSIARPHSNDFNAIDRRPGDNKEEAEMIETLLSAACYVQADDCRPSIAVLSSRPISVEHEQFISASRCVS